MKLSWCILFTVMNFSSFANPVDSIARIRKPVLTYLLSREKQARYLEEEIKLFQLKIKEKDTQLSAKDSIISKMKADSIVQSKMLSTETNKTKEFQSSLEEERMGRQQDKRMYRKKLIVLIGTTILIILIL